MTATKPPRNHSEDTDEIGIGGFVFGYRELDAAPYPLGAWAALLATLAACCVVEVLCLRQLQRMGVRHALLWLLAWVGVMLAVCAAVWLRRSWRQAVLLAACVGLNTLLSADNLCVFLLLLRQVSDAASSLPALCPATSHGMQVTATQSHISATAAAPSTHRHPLLQHAMRPP